MLSSPFFVAGHKARLACQMYTRHTHKKLPSLFLRFWIAIPWLLCIKISCSKIKKKKEKKFDRSLYSRAVRQCGSFYRLLSGQQPVYLLLASGVPGCWQKRLLFLLLVTTETRCVYALTRWIETTRPFIYVPSSISSFPFFCFVCVSSSCPAPLLCTPTGFLEDSQQFTWRGYSPHVLEEESQLEEEKKSCFSTTTTHKIKAREQAAYGERLSDVSLFFKKAYRWTMCWQAGNHCTAFIF